MPKHVLDQLLERLTRLETEVLQMKELVQREKEKAGRPWWQEIAGSHKDDEAFAEIAHLGAEIRRKERQAARRDQAKKKPHKAKDRGKAEPSVRE